MPTEQDRADYRRIGQQIAAQLNHKPLESWSSNRLQALLADLLGRHHDLKLPLLDLMQRPGFLSLATRSDTAHPHVARQSLLQQLQDTFAPRIVAALADVLDGFLNLPPQTEPREPWRERSATAASGGRPAAPDLQPLSDLKDNLHQQLRELDRLGAPSEPPSIPAPGPGRHPPQAPGWPPPQVPPGEARGGSDSSRQVTLLWFVVGLLLSLLVVLVAGNRHLWQSGPAASPSTPKPPPPKQPSPDPLPPQPQPTPPPQPQPSPPAQPITSRWQACEQEAVQDAPPPQPGETWWPVVGPAEALADAQQHCRADAFVSGSSDQVQIASFRDPQVAQQFAAQLSADSSHPWSFAVGAAKVPVP